MLRLWLTGWSLTPLNVEGISEFRVKWQKMENQNSHPTEGGSQQEQPELLSFWWRGEDTGPNCHLLSWMLNTWRKVNKWFLGQTLHLPVTFNGTIKQTCWQSKELLLFSLRSASCLVVRCSSPVLRHKQERSSSVLAGFIIFSCSAFHLSGLRSVNPESPNTCLQPASC